MVNLFKLNSELIHRLFEVGEKWDDPSLTEEEKKYYKQLYERIYDAFEGVQKELREMCMENLPKFLEESDLTNKLNEMRMVDDLLDPKFSAKLKKWRKKARYYGK